ncbi:MAG: pyruvate dehydrogenase E1 component, partial [Candidatus Azotimanducaceae bacterium]
MEKLMAVDTNNSGSVESSSRKTDLDPIETEEWLEALNSVIDKEGVARAQYLLQRLSSKVTETGAQLPYAMNTP